MATSPLLPHQSRFFKNLWNMRYICKKQNFYQIKVITMMKNYDQSVKINHNPNWPYIPDHPYRILIIGDSGSGKTYVLLYVLKDQRPDIIKIYLYAKDLFESMYQLLINGREKVGLKIIHKQLMMFMKI